MATSEDTKQVGIVCLCLVVAAAVIAFSARGCDREVAKDRQLRREAIVRCIEAGKDPLVCEKAMQVTEQGR